MSAPCAVCTLQLFSIGKRAFGANTISLRTTTVFGLFSWRHPVFPTELAKGRGIFVVSPWCMHWCSLGSLHAAMLQWTQPLFVWQGGRLGSKPWSLHMWAYWLCESTSQAFVYMALDTSCQSCQTLLSEAWHQSQASLQLYFLSCQSDIWSFSSWGTDIIKVTNYLLVVISVGTCCLINPNVHQCSLWHHSSYNFCQAVCRSGPMSPGLCPGD